MSHIILSSWLLHPSNAPLRPGSCVTTLRRESIWETRWEAGLAEREGVVSVEASYGNGQVNIDREGRVQWAADRDDELVEVHLVHWPQGISQGVEAVLRVDEFWAG
jgi:hypothetical protein